MPTFPLLALDQKTIEKIADFSEIIELFRLSLCSKRVRNLVKQHAISMSSKMKLDVKWSSDNSTLYANRAESKTDWWFHDPRHRWVPKKHECEHRNIGGVEMELCHSCPCQTAIVSDIQELAMLKFLEFLVDTFAAEITCVNLHVKDNECFLEILKSSCFSKFPFLGVGEGIVTHEEMALILGNNALESCSTSCYVEAGFVYKKPIAIQSVKIDNAQWFSRENLLNLKSSKSRFGRPLKEEDFNDFIRQWYNSEEYQYQDLEYLVVRGMNLLDFDKMIKDLPTFPGTPKKQRLMSYYDHGRVISETRDIRRPSDGMLATIVKPRGKAGSDCFLFVVWHDFDPSPLE